MSSISVFAQNTINSKDFFPYIDSNFKELRQKIKITNKDTIEYVYHHYEYLNEDSKKYLISKTYDSDTTLTTVLKEEITKKGLKFVSGKIIEYDSLNSYVFEVKGKHKITFPFKPISKMNHWKTKWKNSYDNKVIIKSEIKYLGQDSIVNEDKVIQVLNFKRTVHATYKKEYTKEKISYEYIWSFAKGQGMYRYTRKGNQALEGIIIENALIN